MSDTETTFDGKTYPWPRDPTCHYFCMSTSLGGNNPLLCVYCGEFEPHENHRPTCRVAE